jgi:putative transposase
MPYTRLYYHLVWATKDRQRVLTPEIEDEVYHLLRAKVKSMEAMVFAIGGVEDHVHIVASIPAKVAVAHFIGQVKGTTSRQVKENITGADHVYW